MADDVRIERMTRPGEGVDSLIQDAKSNRKPLIKIGILSGTGEHPDAAHGQTLAEIGWWNEFGTATIPERPFLRTGLMEKLSKYRFILGKGLKQVLVKQITSDQLLGVLGVASVADIQAKIVAVNSPPNAESTKRRKGSSSPLQHTGALKQHISWAILEN